MYVQPNTITITATIKGEVYLRSTPETKDKLETNTISKYFTAERDSWVQEEEHPHLHPHGKPLVPRQAHREGVKNVCLQKPKMGNVQPPRAPARGRRIKNKKKTTYDKFQPSITKYFPKQADAGSGFTTTQFMGGKRKREEEFSNLTGLKKLKLTTTKIFLKGKPRPKGDNIDYGGSEVQPDKTKRTTGTR